MNLFIDQELQSKFDEQGYVVINFADLTTVARLQQIFTSIYPKTPEGFFSSSYDKDIVFKQNLSNQLREFLDPLVKKICHHFRPLGCSFLSKSPGISSFMPVHQDWTVVDESKFASVTIWMPLTDTDEKNGALKVLPGSHRFSDALRSPTIPGAFDYLKEDIYPLMNWVKLKAGQAIIFNHALLHASPPNLSDSDRIVVTYGLIPEEAELYFYNRISEHQVAKFRVPYNFFITYNNIGQPPESAELIETLEYAESPFTINLLNRKMYQYRKNKSSAMRPLFKNPEHQSFFEQNGYIVLPALQQHQIDALRAYYLSTGLKDKKGYGFHVGMDAEDKQLVKEMVDKIKEIALAQVQNYLTEIQLFTASFVVKEPNPMGVVPPHQDWTFVEDEESFCSVTCWIPLQDVTIENGCMGVIKGSNRFFSNVRPSPSPQVETPLKSHMYTIFPYLKLVEMKAGEALIFDNRTIHASPPNTSDTPRISVGLGFTQKDAKICHYYLKPGSSDTLLKYHITPDFFLQYDNASLSRMYDKGETISGYGVPEEVTYIWEKLSDEEMVERIKEAGNTYNDELVKYMSRLFNNSDSMTHQHQEAQPVEPNYQSGTTDLLSKSQRIANGNFWKIYTPANIVREIKYRLFNR